MRIHIIGALVCLLSVSLISCEEEGPKSWIRGDFGCQGGGCNDTTFDGTIADSGGEYYGSCKLDGDRFKFTVGHGQQSKVSGTNEYFLSVSGIQGPPVQGVFQDNGLVKDDESLETTFSNVVIVNTNTFSMGESVLGENCAVNLFAEPLDGELEPTMKDEFDYYLHVKCTGLTVEAPSGGMLNSFEMEFYFGNCD